MEFFGSYPVQRGKPTAQHVIHPAEISGTVNHRDGGWLLHHTEQARIPPRIPADAARLLLSEIATGLAGPNPFCDRRKDGRKAADLFRRLLEQMEGEPLGRFPPDTREPG
jgi:hypothetical protein